MKILLLQPPVEDFYDTDIRLQPIGLCYLKAAVKKYIPEVEVVIKDYHQGWGKRTISLPDELNYLKEFYTHPDKSPFCAFHEYFHFGASFEDLAKDVEKEKPDIVGISSLFSPYYREALRCAREIKKRLEIPVLLGGSHVSAMPEFMLSRPDVDFIIRGEGERPLVEFLKCLANGRSFERVFNLGFKRNGRIILNEMGENFPIDEIPVPDISDLAPENYLFEKKHLSFIITSRSCPHRCTFCSVHKTFGLEYRRRNTARVLEEVRRRYEEGVRVFDFEDDNLTFYKEEMKALCRGLIELFPRRDVQFVAMNGISYLSLDDELLELMKKSGFTHLNISLVTSDTTVRETTKRPHTIEKYLQVVRKGAELGLKMVSYQILGLPNESLDSMIQTLVFNARLPVLLGASMFYLTPNSPMAGGFPAPAEADIFKSRLTAMAVETNHFSREDIFTLFITTRIINFLKGLTLGKSDTSLEEVFEFLSRQAGRPHMGGEILAKLFNEGILYAAAPKGFEKIERFKTSLFLDVWSRLDYVATNNGKIVTRSPAVHRSSFLQ